MLNLYSARHYQTDEALYANFTKATGIKINRIDADDAGVITRLQAEGAASPADVVLLVDAARLTKAEADGLFQPVNSAVLQARIPAHLRDANDGGGPAVVRLFDAGAGHRLQQGGGAARRCRHLRGTGGPEEQGQGVHSLRFSPLQPHAVRRDAGSTWGRRPPRPG